MSNKTITINLLSLTSVFIETFCLSEKISTGQNTKTHIPIAQGTGFFMETPNGNMCLITNRHIVTALDSNNKHLYKQARLPSFLKINLMARNGEQILRFWYPFLIALYKNDRDSYYSPTYEELYLSEERVWVEHPLFKNEADFVAIPIDKKFFKNLKGGYFGELSFSFLPVNNIPESNLKIFPSQKVEVIGFPYGYKVSEEENKEFSPVWTSGYIASEPEINHNGKSIFLIDSRTREGNSGSPVFIMKECNNNFQYSFLGIYSGRINEKSDIGIVWKKVAIKELLEYIDKTEDKIIYPFIDYPIKLI